MAADVVHHLAAAGRMANQSEVAQVELFDQLGEIAGILIHVVAVPRLIRFAMATPVMSDDPIAVLTEEQHPRVPAVASERPTMRKEDRLSCSPVVESDPGSVCGRDSAHRAVPFCRSPKNYSSQRSRRGREWFAAVNRYKASPSSY